MSVNSHGNSDQNENEIILTTENGCPIDKKFSSLTVGPRGPILLQDFRLIEQLAHFTRERIPERVVHANGAGAFGYFELTHSEMSKYCKAKIFHKLNQRTPVAVRFSTVSGEAGSSDIVRDIRGFAVKFYSEQGVWDIVGNNTPIFFIRDPILFPSLVHSQKRHPQKHTKDMNMFWDFVALRPETIHQVTLLFGDRGIPDGYRHMNGYGGHTFTLVNDKNEICFCKFHYKTNQGIKTLNTEQATKINSVDLDYSTRDLFDAIDNKNFPSWSLYIQRMTVEQAEKWKWNPFDLTKVWPHSEFPLIEIGKIVLNENPKNYFAQIEQMAFSPSNLIPGIEPSPDKILQGRLFAYPDAHRYRLGVNFNSIPVNRPKCPVNTITGQDGFGCFNENNGEKTNFISLTNYHKIGVEKRNVYSETSLKTMINKIDAIDRHETDEDDFFQAGCFFEHILNDEERKRLARNVADSFVNVDRGIMEKALGLIKKANIDYYRLVNDALGNNRKES